MIFLQGLFLGIALGVLVGTIPGIKHDVKKILIACVVLSLIFGAFIL